MPKQRSPNRDKAFEIYLKHNGKIENRRIAEQLGEDERLVATWKSRDGWVKKKNDVHQSPNAVHQTNDDGTPSPAQKKPTNNSPKKKRGESRAADAPGEISETNTTPLGGAPKGNKNAVGNRGGLGGPPGNQNALVHGAYETIAFDYITDEDELALLEEPLDPQTEMERKAKLHRIRERRMMKRRATIEQTPGGLVVDNVVKVQGNVGNKPPGVQTTALSINSELLRHDLAFNRIAAENRQTLTALHKMQTGASDDDNFKSSDGGGNSNETNVIFVLPDDGRSKNRGGGNE
ncbi:MAG: phage terminase small subunit-related protein [Defluviitaleaceae bacterium]|nr:phage terminase small subunit-related protein [Defluviitaleaceae bacterium]MCL2261674.1 phage terminase small subunit-related protein [Defluviitaleaceae bacterium]